MPRVYQDKVTQVRCARLRAPSLALRRRTGGCGALEGPPPKGRHPTGARRDRL